MYIYARHLYSQKILRFQDNDARFQINRKIIYHFEPYVIFYITEIPARNYEKPNLITIEFDSRGIQLTNDNVYLYGITFESFGKIYHYWSNNIYNIGDTIFIGNEQKEVTVVAKPHPTSYSDSLVNKFFPKENESLVRTLWEYKVKDCNHNIDTIIYANKELSSIWLYDNQNCTIYYVHSAPKIQTITNVTTRDLIEVKPFQCQFINKDNTYSKKTYIYFTDKANIHAFREYYTQYNQLLYYQETYTYGYDYSYLVNWAKKQNYELKFSYKKLREVAQESTSNRLNSVKSSLNNLASSAESMTYTFNNTTISKSNENRKEDNTMNFMKNLEFGKINTSALKMSMCGLAFQRADKTYATYNVEDNSFTEVTDFLMDVDCVFVMPVAAKDIKTGDIIKHLNTYVVVKSINEDGSISAISPIKAEEICVIPTKNLFGFNYYSKVVNFFDGMLKPTDENPFGNPMMLMMLFGDKMDFEGDMKSMLPLFLLNNQNGDMKDLMSNPLFFLAMTK